MAKDMTQGKEWKLILSFTLPLIGGNLLQQIYSLADSLIVGNFAGQTALASVGTSFPITFLLLALATGLTNGVGVMASQFYGAKNAEAFPEEPLHRMLYAAGRRYSDHHSRHPHQQAAAGPDSYRPTPPFWMTHCSISAFTASASYSSSPIIPLRPFSAPLATAVPPCIFCCWPPWSILCWI